MGKISPASRGFILKLTQMGYGARNIFNRFNQRQWTYGGVQKVVENIKYTGEIDRVKGSGRPQTATTAKNIKRIIKLALSPKGRKTVEVVIDAKGGHIESRLL